MLDGEVVGSVATGLGPQYPPVFAAGAGEGDVSVAPLPLPDCCCVVPGELLSDPADGEDDAEAVSEAAGDAVTTGCSLGVTQLMTEPVEWCLAVSSRVIGTDDAVTVCAGFGL